MDGGDARAVYLATAEARRIVTLVSALQRDFHVFNTFEHLAASIWYVHYQLIEMVKFRLT